MKLVANALAGSLVALAAGCGAAGDRESIGTQESADTLAPQPTSSSDGATSDPSTLAATAAAAAVDDSEVTVSDTGVKLFKDRTKNAIGASETLSTDPIVLGKKNPFFHDFGTNGRVCGTCHQESNGWTITPAFAQSRSSSDPLFVFDGSDCLQPGVSNPNPSVNSTHMLDKALVRIDLAIPATADYSLASFTDPVNCPTPPSASDLRMFRRPLPTANAAFLSTVMWDGRENVNPPNNTPAFVLANLEHQTSDATTIHAQGPAGLPAATQAAIVNFETNLFNGQQKIGKLLLDSAGANGGPTFLFENTLPSFFLGINDVLGCAIPNSCAPGTTAMFSSVVFTIFQAWETAAPNNKAAAIGRGELLFNTKSFPIDDVPGLNGPRDTLGLPSPFTGFCGSCHDSTNIGNHSTSLPIDIGITAAQPVGGLDVATLPTYTFVETATGDTVTVTDPGRGLISGKFKDIGKTKGPNLRGLASRAPYFHNGSARDLPAVVDFYNERFHIAFTDQEKSDLVAFLSAL